MIHQGHRLAAGALVATLALVAAACGDDSGGGGGGDTGGGGATDEAGLVGTFELDPGACDDAGAVTGSYFQMVQVGGTVDAGPFVPNADSTCADQSFTLLEPGSDGGLINGEFQPQPDPPFDDAGNGLADLIITPTRFFGIDFAASTNETDPQSGEAVEPITITADGGQLSGDTSAYSVAYGNQQFNQGAPKPDGELPGISAELTGTYDPETGEFEMQWVSQIVGGPFNDFTGIWHFTGTFQPAG